MYSIEIKKDQIPYKTKIPIGDNVFYLHFKYNMYDNRVYCDLLDVDENALCEDEPVVLGQMLFARYYIDAAGNFNNKFPKAFLIPNFLDGANTRKIDYDNIDKARIYIQEVEV